MRQSIKGVGADEWFAVVALLFTAGVTADIVVGGNYGMGKHLLAQDTGADLVAILKVCSGTISLVLKLLTFCYSLSMRLSCSSLHPSRNRPRTPFH